METRASRHKDLDHHSHQPSSSSPRNTECVLSDHQPANHKEFELSAIGEITEEATVNTGNSKEHWSISRSLKMRAHRETVQNRTQLGSRDRMNIARRSISQSLKMRAHRKLVQTQTQ